MRLNPVWTLILSISLAFPASFSSADDKGGGGRESHGYFRDSTAGRLILKATRKLEIALFNRLEPSNGSGNDPKKGDFIFLSDMAKAQRFKMLKGMNGRRNLLIHLLDPFNLAVSKDEYGSRKSGAKLLLDYKNEETGKNLILFGGFFNSFSASNAQTEANDVQEVARRLLWETSHYFGYDDSLSPSFLERFISDAFQTPDYQDPMAISFDPKPFCDVSGRVVGSLYECEQDALKTLTENPSLSEVTFTLSSDRNSGFFQSSGVITRKDIDFKIPEPERIILNLQDALIYPDFYENTFKGHLISYSDWSYLFQRYIVLRGNPPTVCRIDFSYGEKDGERRDPPEEFTISSGENPLGFSAYTECEHQAKEMLRARYLAKKASITFLSHESSKFSLQVNTIDQL